MPVRLDLPGTSVYLVAMPKKNNCEVCGDLCRGRKCRGCWSSAANQTGRQAGVAHTRKEKETCTLEGCPSLQVSKGLCEKHYTRLKRHGSPAVVKEHPKAGDFPACQKCDTRIKSRRGTGLCRKCWFESVRNNSGCKVDGCSEQHSMDGWCGTHYKRVLRHGSPDGGRITSAEVLSKLPEPSGECINWPYLNSKGYGVAYGRPAYRYVWTTQVGPIPAGLELDHLCNNRACVNVKHLEPVTGRENKRRRWVRQKAREAAQEGWV